MEISTLMTSLTPFAKGEQPRPGRLIFVGANRESSVAADDLRFPNGLAFLEK